MSVRRERKYSENHRAPCVVSEVVGPRHEEHLDSYDITLFLDYHSGGVQGFGGPTMSKEQCRKYEDALKEFFEVTRLSEIKGKRCYALKTLRDYNELIFGVEYSGRRFIPSVWWRENFAEDKPKKRPTAQAARRAQLEDEISRHQNRIEELKLKLETVDEDVVDWEREPL